MFLQCAGCGTFELDVDGVVSHQVAAGQQLRCTGRTGAAGPMDFTDVVSLNAVCAQAELAHRVNMGDVLLQKIKGPVFSFMY